MLVAGALNYHYALVLQAKLENAFTVNQNKNAKTRIEQGDTSSPLLIPQTLETDALGSAFLSPSSNSSSFCHEGKVTLMTSYR